MENASSGSDKEGSDNKPKVLDQVVPGMVTGASDNDPAGVATYAVSGIRYGYGQIWLLVLSTPMLIAVQSMAVRIAIITRKGLSANFREHFSYKIGLGAVVLLLFANILTIGADIAAMAEAMALIVPGTNLIHWVVPISFAMWYVVTFFNYKQIRKYFLWLILVFGAFVFSAISAAPDWGEVLRQTFMPRVELSRGYLLAAIAVLGTTIAPYLFYWEARETIEEKVPRKSVKYQSLIQAPGFILSNFIAIMITVATGTLLFDPNGADVTAVQVAQALEPIAGQYATLLFALGIIGAGFLAVPVLAASSALAISGLFGWKEGLSLNPTRARGFYQVISISMLVGVQIAISGYDPIKALFYSQVASGILTPPLIILMLILANSKKVMGQQTNNWFENTFGILAVVVLTLAILGSFLPF